MKILIFDFDGTIVDSKKIYYNAIEKRLGNLFRKKQLDKTIDLGMSLSGILTKLGVIPLVRWWEKRKIMGDVIKHVNDIKKCRDVDSIKNLPYKKILVSNSLSEFILPVLKHLKIKREFDEIYGVENFSDKAQFISDYIKREKISPNECYYIGDRVADVKVARKVGCISIIISNKCSWNTKKEVTKAKPDFIISDLIEMKGLLHKV